MPPPTPTKKGTAEKKVRCTLRVGRSPSVVVNNTNKTEAVHVTEECSERTATHVAIPTEGCTAASPYSGTVL